MGAWKASQRTTRSEETVTDEHQERVVVEEKPVLGRVIRVQAQAVVEKAVWSERGRGRVLSACKPRPTVLAVGVI